LTGKTDTEQRKKVAKKRIREEPKKIKKFLPGSSHFLFQVEGLEAVRIRRSDRKFLLQGGLGMRRQMADVNAWKPKSKLLRIHTSQDKGSRGVQGGKGPLP
jgi:hypothetical protein